MKSQRELHIIVRYSDKFGDAAVLHNSVATASGSVWFGKMGTSVSENWLNIFRDQLSRNCPTWFYIVRKDGNRHKLYKGRLIACKKSLDDPDLDLVPEYYKTENLLRLMSCWFRVERFVLCTSSTLNELIIAKSGSSLADALVSSTSGFFIVRNSHKGVQEGITADLEDAIEDSEGQKGI